MPYINQAVHRTNSNSTVYSVASRDARQIDFHQLAVKAKNGDLEAKLKCGKILLNGIPGVEKNVKQAQAYFVEITKTGTLFDDMNSCTKARAWAHLGDIAQDYPELVLQNNLSALDCYKKAAKLGNLVGTMRVGFARMEHAADLCLQHAGNKPWSKKELLLLEELITKASFRFSQAAKQDNGNANYCLAIVSHCNLSRLGDIKSTKSENGDVIFSKTSILPDHRPKYTESATGVGGKNQVASSEKLALVIAAESGHFGARLLLGKCYLEEGLIQGKAEYLNKAREHFEFANSSKDLNAWAYVGDAYAEQLRNLERGPRPYPASAPEQIAMLRTEAFTCYENAGNVDSSLAFEGLGLLYAVSNPRLAATYFERAARLGSKNAAHFLSKLTLNEPSVEGNPPDYVQELPPAYQPPPVPPTACESILSVRRR